MSAQSFLNQYSSLPTPYPVPTPTPNVLNLPSVPYRQLNTYPVQSTAPRQNMSTAPLPNQSVLRTSNTSGNQQNNNYAPPVDTRSQQQIDLDNVFSEVGSILDRAEQGLRAEQPGAEAEARKIYDLQKPGLEQAKTTALGRNEQQLGQTQLEGENVISAARRLFGELRQANQQRFGGASSAAEFANSILGRELARNLNQTRNTTTQNVTSLRNKAEDINMEFQNQMTQLDIAATQAVQRVKDYFRGRLDDINNSRALTAQQKAEEKLNELRDYRSRVRQLEDERRAYEYELNLQRANAYQANPQSDVFTQDAQVDEFGNPTYSTAQNTGATQYFPSASGYRKLGEDDNGLNVYGR